jgi:lipopolysaccharide export system protein LptC
MDYIVLVGIITVVSGIPALFNIFNYIRVKKNQAVYNIPGPENLSLDDTEVLHYDVLARHLKEVNK